jgi:TRAP-type C4-dicarboxylate transport system permease large subunit
VGLNVVIVAGTVEGGTIEEAFRGEVPFVFGLLVVQVIIIMFPKLATWLPSLVK